MYILDNAADQAAGRFEALAAILDPVTIEHVERRGVRSGWACLEVGAGGGSIARWLADRVGSDGYVLATDIDPRHLQRSRADHLDVRRHDIETDPLPHSAFDLVHARLVLAHLQSSAAALAKMLAALRPGGWLVVEDFDSADAATAAHPLPKTAAVVRQLLLDGGVDVGAGRTLLARLRAERLDEVGTEGRQWVWPGGSAGARLMRANYLQFRDRILDTGRVSPAEFQDDLARLEDPDLLISSPTLWTAWGRRPVRA